MGLSVTNTKTNGNVWHLQIILESSIIAIRLLSKIR